MPLTDTASCHVRAVRSLAAPRSSPDVVAVSDDDDDDGGENDDVRTGRVRATSDDVSDADADDDDDAMVAAMTWRVH